MKIVRLGIQLRVTIVLALLLLTHLRLEAASDVMRSIRVVPLARVAPHTNLAVIKPHTTVTGSSFRVTVPATNASFMIREGGSFRPSSPVSASSTNRTYEIKAGAVYVIQKPAVPRSLTTNATLFSSEIGTRVGDKDITGTIAARLESDELEYDNKNHQYGGTVVFCFRSDANPEQAQKLLPLSIRLYHSPGLQLATGSIEITNAGNKGCQDVRLTCDSARKDASITVDSDALGQQKLTIDFESVPFWDRFQYPFLLLAGTLLGGFGGLIRLWQTPRAKKGGRRIIEGTFCGLVTILLGDLMVKAVFQVNTPVTGSVTVGLAGMIGYFGAKFFERFNVRQSDTKSPSEN